MKELPIAAACRGAGIAAIALLATSCTVGPDFERPSPPATKTYTAATAPELANPGNNEPQQHIAVGEKVAAQWWDLFQSPQLTGVIEDALANNGTLAAAKGSLAQSLEQVAQARGALFPQFDFAADASRQRSSLLSLGVNQLGPIDNLYSIGPTVSYSLDLFGLNRRRIEHQDAAAQYEEYQLDGAYLTLTANAVKEAITIASMRAQIETVGTMIDEDQHTLDLVERELRMRNKTVADLESARTQLATDRALLPTLKQQLGVSRDRLAVLAGKAPGDWTPPDFALAEFTLPKDLPLTVPSALVRERPDILAAEAQLHEASADIGVATAQLYPNISLSASLTQEALKTATLFTSAGNAWSFGAAIAAPIFHGGALEAQKRAAQDEYEAAFATYRQTVLQSFGQVADVLQALDHDAELVAAQEEALTSSERALRAARDSYAVGAVEVLQVIDAERQYEQAQLGDTRAKAQRYLDTVDLFGAMGGGWRAWRAGEAGTPAG